MVNYYVISKNEKAVGQGGETLYGVCACTLHDGVMEVQNCIYGISGDLAWLKTLRGKLNDGEVDPVHLGDIMGLCKNPRSNLSRSMRSCMWKAAIQSASCTGRMAAPTMCIKS